MRALFVCMALYWCWVSATELSWYSVFFALFFAYQASVNLLPDSDAG